MSQMVEIQSRFRISVVIATYNRCEVLKVTLEKLSKQSLSSDLFEVIVVDDGSDDDTQSMMEGLVGTTPYQLRYFRHENRGPGFTENRGIVIAESRLVLLIADDIWAHPDLLAAHLDTHQVHPEDHFAVLGRVHQSPQLPSTIIQKNWDPFRYGRFDGRKEVDSIYFYACNISFKKSFLVEGGLFRERKGAAHEDVELGYRLGKKGLRILYNNRAMADHHHEETLERMCRRAYERGKNLDILIDNIPKAYVFKIYKIASPKAGIMTFIRMLPRDLFRAFVFNGFTVSCFWIPLLKWAERCSFAAFFASSVSYRGVNGYFLRKGFRDLGSDANCSCYLDRTEKTRVSKPR